MKKKNVLLTKPFFTSDIEYIKSGLNSEVNLIIPEKFDNETLLNFAEQVEVFLGPNIEPELLQAAKKLELIQIPWTGVDKLKLENLREYEFVLCNSHSNSTAVAEHSVALALSLLKKVPYHDKELRKGNWNRPKADGENSVSPFSGSIKDLKIGLLGYGSIASKIHKMLLGFECDFYVCSKSKKQFDSNSLVKEFYGFEQLDEFLKSIDVLFICLPLTSETNMMLNQDKLDLLKDSYIINSSRGEVIDEEALFNALLSGKIKGAAIDTWQGVVKDGQLPSKYGFEKLDNVVLSPHRAGMIENALPHLDDAITNINNLSEGKPLVNIVDLTKKY